MRIYIIGLQQYVNDKLVPIHQRHKKRSRIMKYILRTFPIQDRFSRNNNESISRAGANRLAFTITKINNTAM